MLEAIYIAGAFGSSLNIDSCIKLGMLPEIGRDKYRVIGNAAGEGAVMLLYDRELRGKAADIAASAIAVDLTSEPEFQKKYISAIDF